MGTYDKERDLKLTLTSYTKEELKAIAKKDNRKVNNWINHVIDKEIKGRDL